MHCRSREQVVVDLAALHPTEAHTLEPLVPHDVPAAVFSTTALSRGEDGMVVVWAEEEEEEEVKKRKEEQQRAWWTAWARSAWMGSWRRAVSSAVQQMIYELQNIWLSSSMVTCVRRVVVVLDSCEPHDAPTIVESWIHHALRRYLPEEEVFGACLTGGGGDVQTAQSGEYQIAVSDAFHAFQRCDLSKAVFVIDRISLAMRALADPLITHVFILQQTRAALFRGENRRKNDVFKHLDAMRRCAEDRIQVCMFQPSGL